MKWRARWAPSSISCSCKIGAPGHPEYGIGAVVDGDDPQVVLNEVSAQLRIPAAYIERERRRELEEIERKRAEGELSEEEEAEAHQHVLGRMTTQPGTKGR
jgi:predicted phosphoribosyltransferase